MPSFDVVSEIYTHELTNAVDQTNREVTNRFDFKGTNSRIERTDLKLTLVAPAEFQIKQMTDILQTKLSKRGIDVRCLQFEALQAGSSEARQEVIVRQGIDKDMARKLVKLVKETGIKVQAAIQADQVRVTGKKRDDLQQVIAALRAANLDIPLQYTNFRD